MMYVHTPIRLNLVNTVHRNSHNQLSSFSPQSSYISTSPVVPKVVLAKSIPPDYFWPSKVVPLWSYSGLFLSAKSGPMHLAGKEFASYKL